MKLTKRVVDEARPKEANFFVWDDELPGFGLRVWPSGRKVYVLQYRTSGRSHRVNLGLHGVLTPEEARRLAIRTLAGLLEGKDPQEKPQAAPTLKAFAGRFLTEYVSGLKPATQREYRRLLSDVIVPALGDKTLDRITRPEVARLHHSLREHPYQANRALAVLSRLFAVAQKWGYAPEGHNPCRGLEHYKEEKRRRYLSTAELEALGEVLRKYEGFYPAPVLAVRLLLFTGCRLSEILSLTWQQVDLERQVLRLEDTKTGPREVALSAPAVALLQEADKSGEFVIAGRRQGSHLVNLNKFFHKVCSEAGIRGLRLHDLRHTFASIGAAQGLSVYIVGGLLGHKQATTTQRYAHLAASPLHEAADRISAEIAAALEGQQGEVVKLNRNSN